MAEPKGVIRFNFDDKWTLSDFAGVLSRLDSLYLGVTVLIDPDILPVIEEVTSRYQDQYEKYPSLSEAPTWLQAAAGYRIGHGQISHIEMSSPGWLEFIGQLNPLNFLERLISSWRHENTEREKARLEYWAKMAHEDTQRTETNIKTKAALARDVIKSLEKIKDEKSRNQIGRFLSHVMEQIDCDTAYLSRHEKLGEISVRQVS
jgi:hypothetical protein